MEDVRGGSKQASLSGSRAAGHRAPPGTLRQEAAPGELQRQREERAGLQQTSRWRPPADPKDPRPPAFA